MEYLEPKLVDREEEVGIRQRQTGHRNSSNSGTAAVDIISGNGPANGNGSVSEHVIETKFDSSTKRGGEEQAEAKSVYFDQLRGTKFTDGLPSTEFTDVKSSVFEKNTNDVTTNDFQIQASSPIEANHQNGKNLGVDILSGPSPSPIIEPFKEQDIGSMPLISETGVVADVTLLMKLTRKGTIMTLKGKVILRRRKLKLRGRKPKRDLPQTVFHSELGANSAPPVEDQERDVIDISSNGGTVPAADDHDHVQQPDVFRCLSCFSIFIPTGNGFKLFGCFGDNNGNENVTYHQKAPSASTNWFSSIFASGKRTEAEDLSNILHSILIQCLKMFHILIIENTGRQDTCTTYVIHIEEFLAYCVNAGKAPVKITEVNRTTEDNSSLLPSHGNDHLTDGDSVNKGEVAEEFPNKPVQDGQAFLSSSAVLSVQGEKISREIGQEQEANSANGKEIFASQNVVASSVDAGTAVVKDSVSNTIQQLYSPNVTDNMLPQKEKGDSVILDIETGTIQPEASQASNVSVESEILPQSATQVHTSKQGEIEGRNARQWDILKSIVYGGLVESITSLGIVSSAAAAGSTTLNILVLGLANLIGGLPIIFHMLRELKKDPSREALGETNQQEDRYWELLGRRENFALHATVAILSFIIFGLLPPVIYGFSFRESDNRDYKLAAVGVAGLLCIALLAIAKVYLQKPPKSYIKTVTYYLSIGIASSGAAYLAGELIEKVLEMVESSAPVSNASLAKMRPTEQPWAS
ncbi:membrane protein of ER body-like protein [Tripterygium wilfordii]|uniref:Membrane protein of ER body-like protein n=1 Tax=Tripterygium wilfordii TaxID=458696 RepID=A0A7J7DTF5_TRIWF|nr:membrane protein of ER body-like protein [Tripterygium wilfordii]